MACSILRYGDQYGSQAYHPGWCEQALRGMRDGRSEGLGIVPEAAAYHGEVKKEEHYVEDEEDAANGVQAAEPVAFGDVLRRDQGEHVRSLAWSWGVSRCGRRDCLSTERTILSQLGKDRFREIDLARGYYLLPNR